MSNKVVVVQDGKLVGVEGASTGEVLTWNESTNTAAFAVPTSVSFAQEYFVSTGGNDTTGDGSLSAPYATISKAVEIANAVAGTSFLKINVAPGTYSGSFTISRPNILIEGAGVNSEERFSKIAGTVTVDSTAASEAFNQQVGLAGFFIESSTTSPAVYFTGTGFETLSIDGCLVTVTNAAANAILCDSTAATRSILLVRNSRILHQSTSASATVAKFSYGDIRFDSVRLFTTGAGSTGYGVELLNSATLFADRLQIDVTTTAAAIFGSGTSATQKLLMSNSSVTNRGANANSHSISITNGLAASGNVAAYLWQNILSTFNASAKAIEGTTGQSLVYYGALSFGPNASGVINSDFGSGVTPQALREKLGIVDLYSPLTAANGGTGLGAPVAGDAGKVLTATALGTYTLSAVSNSGTVTSVGLTGGTSGIVIGGTASPITTSGTFNLDAPLRFAFNTATPLGVVNPGELSWNTDEGSLELLFGLGTVTSILGQTIHQRVKNDTGSTLTKGQVVYVDGATGDRPTVDLALADADSTSATILGLVAANIADGDEGYIITDGLIKGINTASFAAGDVLYVSPTSAGQITNVKPSAPQHLVMIGYCIKVNASSGEVLIKVQNGYELGELHDVKITSPVGGQVLVYDSTVGETRWENVTLSGDIASVTTAGVVTLKSVGTASTYGSVSSVPVITTDAQGRVSGVVDTNIAINASAVSSIPYDLPAEIPGVPPVSTRIVNFIAVRPFTLLSSGHQGAQLIPASSNVVCTIKKNGTSISSTITFEGPGGGFSSSVTQTSFNIGDVLSVETPSAVNGIDTPFFTLAMTLG